MAACDVRQTPMSLEQSPHLLSLPALLELIRVTLFPAVMSMLVLNFPAVARWSRLSMPFPQVRRYASLALLPVERSGIATAPLDAGYNLGTNDVPLLNSTHTEGFDPSNTVTWISGFPSPLISGKDSVAGTRSAPWFVSRTIIYKRGWFVGLGYPGISSTSMVPWSFRAMKCSIPPWPTLASTWNVRGYPYALSSCHFWYAGGMSV